MFRQYDCRKRRLQIAASRGQIRSYRCPCGAVAPGHLVAGRDAFRLQFASVLQHSFLSGTSSPSKQSPKGQEQLRHDGCPGTRRLLDAGVRRRHDSGRWERCVCPRGAAFASRSFGCRSRSCPGVPLLPCCYRDPFDSPTSHLPELTQQSILKS